MRVLDAPADGETVLINTSAHAYSAACCRLPYDPVLDFVAVAPLTTQAYVVVTGPSAAATSLTQLVAAANAAPGALRYASTGVGTGTHIGVEELNHRLGIDAVHCPAEPSEAILDVAAKVVGGVADYAMLPISIAKPPVAAGDLTALGVTTARRSRAMPHVPALGEVGAAGYDFPIWYGAWVAASTPTTVVDMLSNLIADTIADPDLRSALTSHGMEIHPMPRRVFSHFVADEVQRAAAIVART